MAASATNRLPVMAWVWLASFGWTAGIISLEVECGLRHDADNYRWPAVPKCGLSIGRTPKWTMGETRLGICRLSQQWNTEERVQSLIHV